MPANIISAARQNNTSAARRGSVSQQPKQILSRMEVVVEPLNLKKLSEPQDVVSMQVAHIKDPHAADIWDSKSAGHARARSDDDGHSTGHDSDSSSFSDCEDVQEVEMALWAYIWGTVYARRSCPAAELCAGTSPFLAEILLTVGCKDESVIELGAGSGFTSVAAALAGMWPAFG